MKGYASFRTRLVTSESLPIGHRNLFDAESLGLRLCLNFLSSLKLFVTRTWTPRPVCAIRFKSYPKKHIGDAISGGRFGCRQSSRPSWSPHWIGVLY